MRLCIYVLLGYIAGPWRWNHPNMFSSFETWEFNLYSLYACNIYVDKVRTHVCIYIYIGYYLKKNLGHFVKFACLYIFYKTKFEEFLKCTPLYCVSPALWICSDIFFSKIHSYHLYAVCLLWIAQLYLWFCHYIVHRIGYGWGDLKSM